MLYCIAAFLWTSWYQNMSYDAYIRATSESSSTMYSMYILVLLLKAGTIDAVLMHTAALEAVAYITRY
jgi:cytochrome c oxidase subunit IV